MKIVDLTIREADFKELRSLLMREDGVEAAAYVLCGQSFISSDPWENQSEYRFAVHKVAQVPPEDMISASKTHVTWSTESYVRLLKTAKEEGLVPGIVHIHPSGPLCFSSQDNRNEKDLAQLAYNRNGDDGKLISILFAAEDQVKARLWPDPRNPIDMDTVRVIGNRLVYLSEPDATDADFLARQSLAFSSYLNTRLRAMRVGIVGCGGTGSATVMLLARLGVGRIALFDDDIVEVTNLNRLHGASRADADAMRPKVETLAREISKLDLGVHIVPLRGRVDDFCEELKACDIIFGCTDDHAGRIILNRLAYFYLIPVIDMGLVITLRKDGQGFREARGRATVLFPGGICLLCRDIIHPQRAREESIQRRSPEEYKRQEREAYIQGGGDPAPAVVTFTTETACLAVNELLAALTNFRSSEGWLWQRDRYFNHFPPNRPIDRCLGTKQNPDCQACSSNKGNWGRCDMDPFLNLVG